VNSCFYEVVARERLRDIERQAEMHRLVASARPRRESRLWRWRQRLHLARKAGQPRPVVARGADQAG
jgi:hypothetical protein